MLAQLGETVSTARRWRPESTICAGPSSRRGRWYGRWGLNYIYGTWSVLCALNAAGIDHQDPEMRKAADWLAVDPERRWRLGRGCGQLPTRL